MSNLVQIFTTTNEKANAKKIAERLVEKGLAACVQIAGPISSTYRWKGEIEVEEEWLCIIKSQKGSFEKLEEVVRNMHPYEMPEIVAVPISYGSRDYLKWIENELN